MADTVRTVAVAGRPAKQNDGHFVFVLQFAEYGKFILFLSTNVSNRVVIRQWKNANLADNRNRKVLPCFDRLVWYLCNNLGLQGAKGSVEQNVIYGLPKAVLL
jgi:hypothetical protein